MTQPPTRRPRDASADELSCDAITADFRIYQRRRGHRYSLDDLATAAEAVRAHPEPHRCLDLGCGIGSVLLMVAWRFPHASLLGVEAQALSLSLARRSVALNALDDRVRLLELDLRELSVELAGGRWDLITGTPPYLPPGSALVSPDPQRAAARIELRGGVEDYLVAAGALLAPGGRVVICADGRHPERVWGGAERAGLCPQRRVDVLARPGARRPLLSVWTLARAAAPLEIAHLATRDSGGARTPQAQALRACFGLAAPSDRSPGGDVRPDR